MIEVKQATFINDMEILYLNYFIYNLIVLFIIYFGGHFLLKLFRIDTKTSHGNVFLKICLGLFTMTALFSYIKTDFSSIQTGFILVGFSLWLSRGNRMPIFDRDLLKIPDKKEFLIVFQLFIMLITIYTVSYYYLFGPGRGIPENPHCDMNFFSNISSFISKYGRESFEMNYLDPSSVKNAPYHYFEMWFNAFINFLFKSSNNLACLQLICLPFFICVIISGIWAIMEMFTINIFYKIYSFFIIIISGLYFNLYDSINLYWSNMLQANLLDQAIALKISVIFCALILFAYLLLRKKYVEACICLMIFSFASVFAFINFIPASILLGCVFYFRKKIVLKKLLIILGTAIASVIYYQVFYKFSGGEFYSKVAASGDMLSNLQIISIRSRFVISAQKIMESFILYGPFLIFLFPLFKVKKVFSDEKKEQLKFVITSFTIIYIGSIFAWQFFYSVFGSSEFFQGMANPIVHLSLFFGFYFLFIQNKKTIKYISFWGLMVLSLSLIEKTLEKNHFFLKTYSLVYDADYIKNISSCTLKNLRGGSLLSYEELKKSNVLVNPYNYHDGLYLNYSKPGYHISSISMIDLPGGDAELEKLTKKSFLGSAMIYKFYKKEKKENRFLSIRQCQMDFIKTYKLSFLIVSKDANPDPAFKSLVKQEFLDKISGEKFWILK